MKNKILQMLDLQNQMNSKVNDCWKSQHYEWYRAIWIECGELLEHHGWKWWKKQTPDLEQIQLELVDIWHFGLSLLLESHQDNDSIATNIEKQINDSTSEQGDFLCDVERFAAEVLVNKRFPVTTFYQLLQYVDMDMDSLFKMYIGKNVLNFFRQDHGYKTGEYIKIWNGREDNEYLVDVLEQLDVNSENFQDEIYRGLEAHYPTN